MAAGGLMCGSKRVCMSQWCGRKRVCMWQQEGAYVAAAGFVCGSKCGSGVAATQVSGLG